MNLYTVEGTKSQRHSKRVYTHAVVRTLSNGAKTVTDWCVSNEQAEKKYREQIKWLGVAPGDLEILPVVEVPNEQAS